MKYFFKIIAYLSFFLLSGYFAYSQTLSRNYNLLVEPKIPLTVPEFEAGGYNASTDLIENINYVDGFDKVLQSISRRMNPDQKNIVQFHEYDEFGKESKQYFLFYQDQNNMNFITDPKTVQNQYYLSKYSDSTPFSEVKLDGSPLNRTVEVSKGGDIWKTVPNSDSGKTQKMGYGVNLANEIKLYTIDNLGQINNSQFYAAASLLKNTVKNEKWVTADQDLNTVQVFTDKNGKKIAEISFSQEATGVEKLITQYVYDERGLLRYVLPPKAYNFDFQSYNNGALSWDYKKFLSNENVTGSGSNVTATISNGVLSVNFNAGFGSTTLKTGPVVYLDDRIPNVSLGVLNCTSCTNNNYLLSVENGFLTVKINTTGVATTGFSGTYTANIGTGIAFLSNQQLLDKYAFQYNYDDYNRKTEQKTPGKNWEYNVFDQLDRPILTQDDNLRAQGLWMFTKYDAFERVVYTGKYSSTSLRAALQTTVDNYITNNSSNSGNIEQRSSSISVGGITLDYTNNAFPNANISEIVSVSYYDDYGFADSDKPATPTVIDGQNVTTNTRGLQTANFGKTVGDTTWTKNYTYYDEEARPIYSYEKNILGGYTKTETTFDWRGKVLKTVIRHKKDAAQSSDLVLNNRFEYDHAERLVGEYQSVNSQQEEAIVRNIYDEVGNLKQKKVGGLTTASSPLQLVSYDYNIRGWLTKINDPNVMGSSQFGFKLNYDYDGNIKQVQWKNAMAGAGLETYNYAFDKLNRLVSAGYTNSNNTAYNTSFAETGSYRFG